MTFWGGSGSADPCLLTNGSGSGSGSWIRILLFSSLTFNMPAKNKFLTQFFLLLLFEGTFTSFFKDKKSKKSQNSWNQGFPYYFCMMIEGSGSGSIPLTSGSGSGRPKNMWIPSRVLQKISIQNEDLCRENRYWVCSFNIDS